MLLILYKLNIKMYIKQNEWTTNYRTKQNKNIHDSKITENNSRYNFKSNIVWMYLFAI